MTRNELRKLWCAAEGGEKSALDWPQSGEAYAKMRRIIAEECGVDLDDIIRGREVCKLYAGHWAAIAFRYLPMRPDGTHYLPKRSRARKAVKK